jgi:hypothetical protein
MENSEEWIFKKTNEDLKLIYDNLKFDENSKMYSILGSGDIPFLAISLGAKVYAKDRNFFQKRFVEARIKSLKDKDYISFSNSFSRQDFRDCFFSDTNNLDKIQKNLDYLVLDEGDIFKIDFNSLEFNLIYLSNAFEYLCTPENTKQTYKFFREFILNFRKDSIFYLTSLKTPFKEYGDKFLKGVLDIDYLGNDGAFNHYVSKKII